jgi:non-ribosomal peptide synthetase component F/NRPS condensation-like uncharacterized protein/acyl carrier protein
MATPSSVERVCRLTPLQDGMFFEALRKQGSTEVNYQICLELSGELRPALLREAWRTVVRRHPILRTSFHYERLDVPVQVAHRDADPPWSELDWRGVDELTQDGMLADLLDAERAEPFELTAAPLMRLTCARTAGNRFLLVWTYHHLLLDGWSMYLVLDDVTHCYRELAAGRIPALPPTRPYWEYVAWLQQQDGAGAEEFWRRRLAGFTTPTPVGYEEVHATAARAEFGEVVRTLPDGTEDALADLAARHRITQGTAVQAAWAVALSRYTGREDVVFGNIVSGRPPEFDGADDIVGLFINMLPVRAVVRDDMTLPEWLAGFQEDLLEARQHQHAPLTTIQQWSAVPRGMQLFESIAVFINYPVRESWTDGGEATVTGLHVVQEPHYPLHLTVVAGDGGWRLTLGYDAARFRHGTAERIIDLFRSVLTAISACADDRVGDLPHWTATAPLADLAAGDSAPAAGWPDLIRAVAATVPGNLAVLSARGGRLTYRDLLTRAQSLATRMRAVGAGPGRAVELRMARSPELVVALTATALAGAAVAVEGAAGDLVCAADAAQQDGFAITGWLDAAGMAFDPFAPATVAPDSVVTWHGMTTLLWWSQRAMPLSEDDVVLDTRPGSSFAGLRDLLWALARGATVVTDEEAETHVTVATVTAESAHGIADQRLPALRRVLVSPGPVNSATLRLLRRRTAPIIEEFPGGDATRVSTFFAADRGEALVSPPVGRRRTGERVFPRSTGQGLTEDDPRLWTVEAVLARHPAISDAVVRVVTTEDKKSTVVAYVVADENAVTAAALSELVAVRLGRTLVPDKFITLAAIPATPDGRVDITALPAGTSTPADGTADQLTAMVIEVWAQVFDISPAQLDKRLGFFDIGGHSLMAIRLVSRIRATFGIGFTLNDLFAAPSIEGCVRMVRSALVNGDAPDDDLGPIVRAPRDRPLPMSFSQERFWFLDQIRTGQPNNVLLPSRIAGRIDPDVLRVALRQVVRRHEILRTYLSEKDGVPVQLISEEATDVLVTDDLSGLPLDVAERQARALLEADAVHRFDLAAEPPLRVRLVRLSAEDHVLGLCIHHVAFDGWSTRVLFVDLTAAYQAAAAGDTTTLPELPVQYADFAQWQRQRLAGARLERLLGFWRDRLAGAPDVLDLAPALPAGAVSNVRAEHETFLPGDLTGPLERLAAQESSTLFMALLAGYAVVLARQSGRDDVVIASPVAGRDHPDAEGLIGFFVNTVVLRADLSGEPTFRELLRRVRKVCLDALAHSEMPFEKLVSSLRPDRVADRLPLAQVAFTFQAGPAPPLEFDGRACEYFPVSQGVARFELDIEAYPWDGGVKCVFRYSVDRYRRGLATGLAAEYVDLIRRFVADPDQPVLGHRELSTDELSTASLTMLRSVVTTTSQGDT